MIDVVDRATRSRMMAGIKGKNTKPERFLRSALHGMGYRYRLGGRGLPGRPDLVFPARRVVVFVHGCFWHMHDCEYFKWPSNNASFWREKIVGNAARDKQVHQQLEKAGWKVVVVWECELRRPGYVLPNRAIRRLERILEARASLR